MHIRVLLPLIAAASYCPTFTCEYLPQSVCANYTGGSAFQLNSQDPCAPYEYCSLPYVARWAEVVNTQGLSSVVPSASRCISLNTTNLFEASDCGQRLTGKEFAGNATLVLCDTYEDCILTDGTTTSCMCVFRTDGKGVCEAHPSNEQLFGKYWEECGDDSVLHSQDTAEYWLYYMAFWEFTQSTVKCVDIFYEIGNITSLYEDYDGAGVIGVFSLLVIG